MTSPTFTAFGDVYRRLNLLETEVDSINPSSGLGSTGVYSGTHPFDINTTISNFNGAMSYASGQDVIGFLESTKALGGIKEEVYTLAENELRHGQILRFFNTGVSGDATYQIQFSGESTQLIKILPSEAYSLVWNNNTKKFIIIPGFINGGQNSDYTPV